MRHGLCLFLIFLAVGLSNGQKPDSINLSKTKQAADSLEHKANQKMNAYQSKLDSLNSLANLNRFKDSLKIQRWSDSLKGKINVKFSPERMSHSIDSLRASKMPTERITRTSDSLLRRKDALLSEVGSKQGDLQKRVSSRYDKWTQAVRNRFNLDSAGVSAPTVPGASLPNISDPLQKVPKDIPGIGGLPGTKVPALPTVDLPESQALNTADFSALQMSGDLKSIGGDMSIPSTDQLSNWDKGLPSMPDPMKEITGRTAELKALTKDPGVAAENAVSQISDVNSATQQLQQAEQLKNNEALLAAEQLKDPDAVQQTLQREAVNHFQCREAVLTAAMDKMAKYKEKYSSLASMADVKKTWLPINILKGKPFRERFRIGMNIGFRTTKDTLLLDFYPNASYRISGRFEAGLGFMYRLRVQTNDFDFVQENPVWGANTFVIAKTFKSVYLRVEVDGNSYPKPVGTDQSPQRDWRWTFLSGIQTNFTINNHWTWNVQMLYNFDYKLKDGFPERLVLRMGAQYKLSR